MRILQLAELGPELYQLRHGFPIALLIASTIPAAFVHYVLAGTILERNTAGLVMPSDSRGGYIKQCAASNLHRRYLSQKKTPVKYRGCLNRVLYDYDVASLKPTLAQLSN